ncbi:antichymotrypsin-2-like isoform X2 [Choristoneura fumiferana]|uniref:antichymotrypsin-2-like isoform X2 n=1 Tax=Choristoneura fumiferana TaxID=7141 RepID=UPI003D15C200
MVLIVTVERCIATIYLLLVVTPTFGYKRINDYSEEDLDYDRDFESYTEDYEKFFVHQVPLNLKGTVRKHFLVDTALTNPSKSMICSPVSALLPLGKLAIGAQGKCLNELLSAIGIESLRKIRKEFKPLIRRLGSLSGVTLTILSKIFVSKEVELKSKFRRRAKKIFNSAVERVDFHDPTTAAKEINGWVRDKTHNKIPRIVLENEISPQTSLVLVNAVYFSGTWLNTFKKIKVDKFYAPSSVRSIPFLTREGYYNYSKSDDLDAQVVEIPYQGEQASFVVILPNSRDGLPVLLHKLKVAPELLTGAVSHLRSADLILTIPKFKTETEIDLKVSYEKLGITEIFRTDKSGLDKIVKEKQNIHVSKAKQKAIIEVTEKGTEAAAASATHVALSAKLNRIIFRANHPFMYIIKFQNEQIFSGIFSY